MIVRVSSNRIEKAVVAAKVPVVVVDSSSNSSVGHSKNRCARIVADSEAVAGLAVKHFWTRGIKHFGFIGVPSRDGPLLRQTVFNNSNGYIRDPSLVYPSKVLSEQTWVREKDSLANWLEQLRKPIGIVAYDDERGLQVLEACRMARLTVPNEVAVLGVGNDELLCSLGNPPLSSVALNVVNAGYRAAQLLDRLMRKSIYLPQQLIIHPISIVARSSTDVDISHDRHVSAVHSMIQRQGLQDLTINDLAKSLEYHVAH